MTMLAETCITPAKPASLKPPRGNALLTAGRLLAEDLASSLVFAGVYATTHNPYLATGLAIALGVSQIGWRLTRRLPIDALQWMSLGLVVVFGAASLLTHDPRFLMVKPTLIYVVIGSAMLKRGWMTRYMPPEVLTWAPRLPVTFGYIWAVAMFATAALNLALVGHGDVTMWAVWLAIFPVASKLILFGAQYLTTRVLVRRRIRAA